MGLNRTL